MSLSDPEIRMRIQDGLTLCRIPKHMHSGLTRYVERGVRPGDFLVLMLQGRIEHAAHFADPANMASMQSWETFLAQYMPDECHGDAIKVQAWLDRGGLDGRAGH